MKQFLPDAQIKILFLALLFIAAGTPAGLLGEEWVERKKIAQTSRLEISDVRLSASSFDPNKDPVTIRFSLSGTAAVRLKVFDPDFELVRTLPDESKKPGEHRVAWDGKDMAGVTVPDEAYFFTIEAEDGEGHTAVYDPVTFSGGEVYSVDRADFQSASDQVKYDLPHAARVLIRLGTHKGPLLRTLVDWRPRPAGPNTEPWDGRDESGEVAVRNDPRFVALITYFTLPEHSIIVNGNAQIGYDEYKARLLMKRPRKEERSRTILSDRPLSPHFLQPRATYRNPKIQVTLSEIQNVNGDGRPGGDRATVVRVDMDEKEKALIKDHKTELYLFLDHRFLMEEGQARIPYDFRWDFSKSGAGEHILTINLVTDHDQIGTVSQKVVIENDPATK